MSNISIRLPKEIEQRLEAEARLSNKNRSELVREAVGEYLTRRQKQRFMAEYVAEMRQAYADPKLAAEARQIQRDLDEVDTTLDRLIDEERAAGIDPEERWWE